MVSNKAGVWDRSRRSIDCSRAEHLSLKDGKPQLLRLDNPFDSALPLIALVQGIKSLSPAVSQARCLIWAHQGPLAIGLHPPHEQVIHPQAIKQIPGPDLQQHLGFVYSLDKVLWTRC